MRLSDLQREVLQRPDMSVVELARWLRCSSNQIQRIRTDFEPQDPVPVKVTVTQAYRITVPSRINAVMEATDQ